MEKLTPYIQFKKDMRKYFNTTVDAEEGETFNEWFSALMDAIEEEGNLIKDGCGRKYIRGN